MSRLGFILNNCVRLGMGQWIIHTLLNKFKWTISFKDSNPFITNWTRFIAEQIT